MEGELIHGTAVAVGDRGVLITGAPGTGKSGLALEMIALGARLVADDAVLVAARDGVLTARAPDAIAGRIEARGIGLLRLPAHGPAGLALHVDLDTAETARLPAPHHLHLAGLPLRSLRGRDHPGLAPVLVTLLQPGAELELVP